MVVGLFCPEKNRKVCRPTVKTRGTTQNKTKSLALFVIEGAILLSASKIFACIVKVMQSKFSSDRSKVFENKLLDTNTVRTPS